MEKHLQRWEKLAFSSSFDCVQMVREGAFAGGDFRTPNKNGC
jgi:hypothetical protein